MSRNLAAHAAICSYSMTALGCAIVLDRHRRKAISWLGIGMSVAALLHWSFMIWFEPWSWNGGYRLQELLMKIGVPQRRY